MERLLLTVSEAAGMLGIGRSLLYDLLTAGQVESIHVGRLRRIPAEALAAYIDRQRCRNPGPGPEVEVAVAVAAASPPRPRDATQHPP